MIVFKEVVMYEEELEVVKEKLEDSMRFLIPNLSNLKEHVKYGKDINEFIKLRTLLKKSIEQINKLLIGIKENPLLGFDYDELKYYSSYTNLLTYFNIKGGRSALDELASKSNGWKNWDEMKMSYSSPQGLIDDDGVTGHYTQAFVKAIKLMSPKARKMPYQEIITTLRKL